MDQVSAIAASGLRSRMDALDMLANNLANSSTGGFKLDREFYSLFSAHDENQYDGEGSPSSMPSVKSKWTDFAQGTLQPTGNPLDLAITGQGFFVAAGPTGPLYTRNGAFKLSPTGILTTAEGYPLKSITPDRPTIQSQSQSPITFTADGTVQQDGETIGQLDVADFKDRTLLEKLGNSYYVNSNPKVQPAAAADASIEQGRIENSNVAPAESAVRLVGLMRQFEMLQKAVTITADMNKKSIDELTRVGGGV
jgi:flagellar basal-body rod protein FlgF